MKRCPFCGVENDAAADVCYYCGQPLTPAQTPGAATEPTQPLRPQGGQPMRYPQGNYPQGPYPPPPYDTQPLPPYPPGSYPPGSYPPASYAPGSYPPPYTPSQAGGPGYDPSAQGQPPGGYPPGSYPPPQPGESSRRSCAWSLVGALFGMIFLCVVALALLSLTGAGRAITSRLIGQAATPAGVPFGNPTQTAESAPTEPAPTLTPEAGQPDLTATPDATQRAYIDKLLSPGCKSALDTLNQASHTATQDPLKLLDETWRTGFNEAVAAMKANCGTLDSASPVPGEVAQLNQSITQASSELDTANQLWTDAVNNRSPRQALQAAQHIGAAANYLGQALAEIKAIAP